MGFLDKISKGTIEKLLEVAYDVVIPFAEDFVKKTSNPYDDAVLATVKGFLRDLINDISDEDGD